MRKIKAIFICLLSTAFLFACSSSPSTPKETLEVFAKELRNMNFSAAQKYSVDPLPEKSDDKNINKLLKIIYNSIDLEIQTSVGDSKSERITVRVTTIDAQSAMNDIMTRLGDKANDDSVLSKDEMNTAIVEQLSQTLSSPGASTATSDLEILMIKDGDSWKVKITSSVVNAMTNSFADFASVFD